MYLQFFIPIVLGGSIVFVFGTLITRLLTTSWLRPVGVGGTAAAVATQDERTPFRKHLDTLFDRLNAIMWFNIKLLLLTIEALVVWLGMYQLIMSAIEQVAAVGAIPDVIAWSMALGFLVCAAGVRLYSLLNNAVDALMTRIIPYLDRLSDAIEKRIVAALAPLKARIDARFPPAPEPMRWRDIVAEFGPMTDKEVAARRQHNWRYLPLAIGLLMLTVISTLGVVIAIAARDTELGVMSWVGLIAGFGGLHLLEKSARRSRDALIASIKAAREER